MSANSSFKVIKSAIYRFFNLYFLQKGTPTGIPFPRIHLGWRSVETLGRVDSCLAGAGTLLLEMGTLSLLLQDPQYATLARNAVLRLWNYRSRDTGLLGASTVLLVKISFSV